MGSFAKHSGWDLLLHQFGKVSFTNIIDLKWVERHKAHRSSTCCFSLKCLTFRFKLNITLLSIKKVYSHYHPRPSSCVVGADDFREMGN